MAFWGTEVKPGKPFTHKADSTRERLHISQATLGNCNNAPEQKSMVQCNVGNNSPVFLCSLFPKQSESCQLNLEFDESVDVIFSVIGPRSVHLTGYYLRSSTHYNDDHSESYGEDIADTETERSAGGDENEDGYEDSFINDDDDPQLITPSPVSSDGEAAEALLESKPKNKKAVCRRLKKKYQIQSDEDNSQQHNLANGGTCVAVLDSESEDMLTISSLCKSAARSTKPKAEENAQKETSQALNEEVEDGGNGFTMAEQKGNIILDSEETRQPDQPDLILDYAEVDLENGAKPNKKKKKQSKKEKELEAGIEDDLYGGEVLQCDQAKQSERKVDQSSQIIDVKNEDDQRTGNYKQPDQPESFPSSTEVGLESSSQPKKKKKTRSKEEKELKAGSENDSVLKWDQANLSETKVDLSCEDTDVKNEKDQRTTNYNQPDQHESLLRPTVLGLESSAMPKKKKKRQSKEEKELKARIGDDSVLKSETKADPSSQDVDMKNEEEQRTGNDKSIVLAMPSDPQLLSSQFTFDNCLKPKRKRKGSDEDETIGADSGISTNDINMDKSSQDEFKCDGLERDGSLQDEQNQSNFEQSVNENRSRKKKKKKKKTSKTQENGEALNMEESKNKSLIGIEENNA